MNELTENERKFILGLEKLTRETGLAITADSYFGATVRLEEVKITSNKSGYCILPEPDCMDGDGGLTWLDQSDNETWNNYNDTIVKEKATMARPRESKNENDTPLCPYHKNNEICIFMDEINCIPNKPCKNLRLGENNATTKGK